MCFKDLRSKPQSESNTDATQFSLAKLRPHLAGPHFFSFQTSLLVFRL